MQPAALRLVRERDPLFELQARRLLENSQEPEKLVAIAWSFPKKGALPEICFSFHLQQDKRPHKDRAPCPICKCQDKYLRGAFVWFPSEGVYRCIGIECIAHIVGEDAAALMKRTHKQSLSRKSDYAFVFDNILLAPEMKNYFEALLPAAVHAEKLRRDLGRAKIRTLLWGATKQNAELTLWEALEIERFNHKRNTDDTRTEAIALKLGRLSGLSALDPKVSLTQNLRKTISYISALCREDAQEWALNSYDYPHELKAARVILAGATPFKNKTVDRISDVLDFFTEENFAILAKYGEHPLNPNNIFASYRNGVFRIGETMAEAIVIRPDFSIIDNLPRWPETSS